MVADCLTQLQVNRPALSQLPSVENLKRAVRTSRKTDLPRVKDPETRLHFLLPDFCKTLSNDVPFLLHDSGPGENRIIMFGTSDNLQVLRKSPHWFADGTFKHSPRSFAQIYTLHALQNCRCLPLVYCLLPNKTRTTYDEVLNILLRLQPNLNPITVMTDYEQGMQAAFQYRFPNVQLRGCLFHFNQCIYRSIQDNGYKRVYDTDSEFALTMRFLSALAFVPTPDVVHTFEYLQSINHFPDYVSDVVEYFEDNWIGQPRRRTRKQPLHPIALWNQYDATLEGLPRTNNAVEGWHRGFDALTTRYHHSLWEVIENFKREQALTETTLEQDCSGGLPPPKKRRIITAQDRLVSVVLQYEEKNEADDLEEYLKGVAHNLKY